MSVAVIDPSGQPLVFNPSITANELLNVRASENKNVALVTQCPNKSFTLHLKHDEQAPCICVPLDT
jgi:hypothetical protein